MFYKIVLLFSVIFLTSCKGFLYEGDSNNKSRNSDTVNIIIVIEDPMWDAYLEWLKYYGEE